MITPVEFITRWGANNRVQFDSAVVNILNVASASKEFLMQAGLPAHHQAMHFDVPPNTIPPLSRRDSAYYLPHRLNSLRLLGKCYHDNAEPENVYSFICLDEHNEGRVVCVENSPGFSVEVINTSIAHLAEMLLLLEENDRWRLTMDAEDYEAFEQHNLKIAANLRQVDPEWLQGEGGWTEAILCVEGGL